ISPDFLFGVEPVNGRDVFSRIIHGSRISLLIAFLATLLSVALGTVMGVVAGYFGGWVDTLISRTMDVFLAFPLLLFAIALAGVVPDQAFGLAGDTLRIALMVFIIGFFNWPYIGRIVRGQALSLREREFIDAARSLGARSPRILFTEMLPNLAAPILVYSTLLIPTNILFEAAQSFLGVGVRPPTPTWGGMLSEATHWFQIAPNFMLFPGLAIFVTVLAFNLFGDGLRDALDPRSR
ncbi:MAG: ABC transporter permease, partial [Actinomycetota bacterium]|nr:ABC transporter permease [Actinomycetota bacterium]